MEFPNPVSKLVYRNLTMAKQGFYLELLQHTTTIKAESPVLIDQRRSDRGLLKKSCFDEKSVAMMASQGGAL